MKKRKETIDRYIEFLKEFKKIVDKKIKFGTEQLKDMYNVASTTYIVMEKLGYIEKKNYRNNRSPIYEKYKMNLSNIQPYHAKEILDGISDYYKTNKKTNNSKTPTKQEVVEYFVKNGYSEELAKKAYNYYLVGNWKDSRGHKVRNWKQKMQAVWFNERNRQEVSNDKTDFLQNKTIDNLYELYFNIKTELLKRGEDANDYMAEEELHDQLKKRGYTGNLNLKFEF